MDLHAVDLNLLVVFDAMAQHRSVTRAGEAVGLSQPAMSAAVARLRRLFDDPLFVRTAGEMRATPRATELAAPVRRVLEIVRGELLQRPAFDASRSDRTFTIITPDIGEINFLPRLLPRFTAEAPGARLRAVSLPRAAAADALAAGDADIALGYFPDLQKAGFFQQKLFDNPHVCLVRERHPTIGARIGLDAYLAAAHAVVRPDGREHVFEQFMQQRGLERRVVLELSHFMSLLVVIDGSDLIATVPRDLADICLRHAAVRIVEPPLEAPVIAIRQFWHRRFHRDPANRWLRDAVHAVLAATPAARAKPPRPGDAGSAAGAD